MRTPKISIITINYNEPLLERTCKSVLNQTFKDYEWIIIDGGSTNPATIATLKKFQNHTTYFVSEPDEGLYNAMNKGIAQAKGEWCIFMNGGDCFHENETLQKMIPYIKNNKEAAVVYGGTVFEFKKKPKTRFVSQFLLSNSYFISRTISHPSSFIRRDMFAKYGNYREDLRIVSDWAKFAQMYWAGEKFKAIDVIVANYNVDGISSTLNPNDVFMEHAKIWSELQPWVFDIKTLKYRKYFYGMLRSIFFVGKLNKLFRSEYKQYKVLIKYTEMYKQQFMKERMLYVDHSFHQKTHSTDFFVDILKSSFDVEVVYDDSWKIGKKYDFNKYDFKKYKYIIFFQLLPPSKVLRKIRHKNIFYVPMEEIVRMSAKKLRRRCKNLKFINFTKIGHKRVSELGGISLFVRFFIKPTEFCPGDKSKVFFWQRISVINIRNVIKALPSHGDLSIHLHTTIDPYHSFVSPNPIEEKKYNITYSDWFPDKSNMIDLIKAAGIYIAPRSAEGIGMSFLEAMAMGKAIIAHNASTMNEYIENGVNGYIVDFNNPEQVDLSDIEWVQKNAYETAKFGYARWMNDKKKIKEFIKGEL